MSKLSFLKKKNTESTIDDAEKDINLGLNEINVFLDTRNLMPGFVVYTVEPMEIKSKYTIYHPVARVITQVHDSGVNGGTIFLTYKPVKNNPTSLNNEIQVGYENDTLYSPLTKEQALYISRLLNKQSREYYLKLKSLQKQNTKQR